MRVHLFFFLLAIFPKHAAGVLGGGGQQNQQGAAGDGRISDEPHHRILTTESSSKVFTIPATDWQKIMIVSQIMELANGRDLTPWYTLTNDMAIDMLGGPDRVERFTFFRDYAQFGDQAVTAKIDGGCYSVLPIGSNGREDQQQNRNPIPAVLPFYPQCKAHQATYIKFQEAYSEELREEIDTCLQTCVNETGTTCPLILGGHCQGELCTYLLMLLLLCFIFYLLYTTNTLR